jgi:hypothetical protein
MTHTEDARQATTHIPEPWDHDMGFIVAPDPTGQHPDVYVAEIAHSDEEGRIAPYEQHEANARRIVAAVNACQGLTTGALEQGIVTELLTALKGCLFVLDENLDGGGPSRAQAIAVASALIAKATAA